MKRLALWVDAHWTSTLWSLGVIVIGGGYAAWTVAAARDPLLARLSGQTRQLLYGSLAATGGALLGFTIASLAILFTLDPAREAIRLVQERRAWVMLNRNLVAAAATLTALLVVASLGLAIDGHVKPRPVLEAMIFTTTVIALAQLVVGGIAFALVVLVASGRAFGPKL